MSGDVWGGGGGCEPPDRPLWSSTDAELKDLLCSTTAAIAAAEAVRLRVIAELDARAVPVNEGATSTKVWLRETLRIKDAHAGTLVKLAREISEDVLDSLATGALSVDHAAVVVRTVRALPAEVGVEVRDRARAALVGFAGEFDPQTLAGLGKRILDFVAPEVAEAVLERQLQAEERRAHTQRSLTLRPLGDGRVRISGVLDVESAAIVRTGLEALCNPRVADRCAGSSTEDSQADPGDSHDETSRGCSAHGDPFAVQAPTLDPAWFAASPARGGTTRYEAVSQETTDVGPSGSDNSDGGQDAVPDRRTVGQKMADALVEVFRRALAADVLPDHGGRRPQLLMTLPYDVIAGKLGQATLETGELLSAATVRRLACDAAVLPVVLGGRGEVLDVGRGRRLYGSAARKALIVRDGGCAFPGCRRPPSWCDIHHIVFWLLGGKTDVDNGMLLCWHHHRIIHLEQWKIRAVPGGRPWFIPPAHVDPERRPRRNGYHRGY